MGYGRALFGGSGGGTAFRIGSSDLHDQGIDFGLGRFVARARAMWGDWAGHWRVRGAGVYRLTRIIDDPAHVLVAAPSSSPLTVRFSACARPENVAWEADLVSQRER